MGSITTDPPEPVTPSLFVGAGPDSDLASAKPERLKRGQLSLPGVVASTLANIAPAMSFYFGFALIAYTAGVASPLTIIAAMIAVIFVGNTLAQFSRLTPSTGSWVSFIGKGLGPVAATMTAAVYVLGLMPGAASLMGIQGGWLSDIFQKYCHVDVPWQLLSVVLALIVYFLVARGVSLSTKAAGALFAFEVAILTVVCVWILIADRGHLLLTPFEPSHLASGWKGLGLGFPLAIYMFIGWENSAALAEETNQPRKNIPKAIFSSIGFMALFYIFLSYATVVGSNYNANTLGNATVPFITVAQPILGGAIILAYLAGFTSIMSSVIAAVNAQSRVVFSAGREGMLPSFLGRVSKKHRTPSVALGAYLLVGTAIALWWGWSMNTVTFYDESATLCVIPIILIYFVVNASLIAYTWKRPDRSVWKHTVLPVLGIAAIAFPFYELVKPGQPTPYDLFPYVTLVFVAVALVHALLLRRRDPKLA
jgi:amino acid transporter